MQSSKPRRSPHHITGSTAIPQSISGKGVLGIPFIF